jgi:hypothetical protein
MLAKLIPEAPRQTGRSRIQEICRQQIEARRTTAPR